MIAVAILRRRLRQGKSYEDFRKAWFHEEGFGAPNRMLTMLNIADPREVIVIAMTEVKSVTDGVKLIDVDKKQRSASPLDEIIEPEIDRTFGILVAEDDFSAAGTLEYQGAAVGGAPTNFAAVTRAIKFAGLFVAPFLRPRPPEQSRG